MKRVMTLLAAGVAAGVIVTMALPSGAVSRSPAAGQHHTSHSYFLRAGHSRTFDVPGSVTRIDVAAAFEAPPSQTPKSSVMTATMGYNGSSHHLSWVGTNSDGSQRAGDEGSAKTVAKICGSTCAFALAKLAITTGPSRLTLVFLKHAHTSANFTINLWY